MSQSTLFSGNKSMKVIRGAQIKEHVEDLAKLRIAVFNEYPYLYQGSMEYERDYLSHYAKHPDSLLLRVDDEAGLVGACTGVPLSCEPESFQSAFPESERATLFYIGELILRPDARSLKLGTELFPAILNLIDPVRYRKICLCMVEREENHSLRPAEYFPPDALAKKFGFIKSDGAKAYLSWKDINDDKATPKSLQIWFKES